MPEESPARELISVIVLQENYKRLLKVQEDQLRESEKRKQMLLDRESRLQVKARLAPTPRRT